MYFYILYIFLIILLYIILYIYKLIRGQRRNLSMALLGFVLQQEGTKTRGTLAHSLSVCCGGGGKSCFLK